ncbi:TIGR02444 family protein [Phenylobacterium hankyongense]|uniref:TIGR02444 family protein n=1 Tax=Phenylobacterium hankyongense TaxID=1813876 RepID=A0A328AYF2_9CAUL|nr:TIGR02444 family protein [Phenylobacterium hankyongense]RAK59221.1 TIGR02444 family protein [Phenylobacterium hankyongense]
MSLWDWTLAVYGRPGVPEACLALQDAHGQNTSFLLWAVWAEAGDPALLEQAAAVARAWEGAVLAPLRTVRRTLKAAAPPVDDGAREGLRDDVKAAELRAERVLMETLEALAPDARGGTAALQALKAASAAWGRPAPDQALAALAAAFD